MLNCLPHSVVLDTERNKGADRRKQTQNESTFQHQPTSYKVKNNKIEHNVDAVQLSKRCIRNLSIGRTLDSANCQHAANGGHEMCTTNNGQNGESLENIWLLLLSAIIPLVRPFLWIDWQITHYFAHLNYSLLFSAVRDFLSRHLFMNENHKHTHESGVRVQEVMRAIRLYCQASAHLHTHTETRMRVYVSFALAHTHTKADFVILGWKLVSSICGVWFQKQFRSDEESFSPCADRDLQWRFSKSLSYFRPLPYCTWIWKANKEANRNNELFWLFPALKKRNSTPDFMRLVVSRFVVYTVTRESIHREPFIKCPDKISIFRLKCANYSAKWSIKTNKKILRAFSF